MSLGFLDFFSTADVAPVGLDALTTTAVPEGANLATTSDALANNFNANGLVDSVPLADVQGAGYFGTNAAGKPEVFTQSTMQNAQPGSIQGAFGTDLGGSYASDSFSKNLGQTSNVVPTGLSSEAGVAQSPMSYNSNATTTDYSKTYGSDTKSGPVNGDTLLKGLGLGMSYLNDRENRKMQKDSLNANIQSKINSRARGKSVKGSLRGENSETSDLAGGDYKLV